MKYVEGHYQQVEGNGKEQTLELPDVAPDRIVGIHAWPTPKGASKTWTNNQPFGAGDDLQASGLLGSVSIGIEP